MYEDANCGLCDGAICDTCDSCPCTTYATCDDCGAEKWEEI